MPSEDALAERIAAVRAELDTFLKDESIPKSMRKQLKQFLKVNPMDGLPLQVQEKRLRLLVSLLARTGGPEFQRKDFDLRDLVPPRGPLPTVDDTPFSPGPRRLRR